MEPTIRARKRRRVVLACSSCRARKTKCDARQPACSTCRAAGQECEYSSQGVFATSNVMINKEYLRSLEEKVQMYESRGPAAPAPTPTPVPIPQSQTILSPASETLVPPNVLSHSHQSASPLQGTAHVGSTLVTADPDVFLGGHSGISFTQLIWNAMSGWTNDKLQTQSLSHKRREPPPQSPSDIFSLPPDATRLIEIFFDVHFELGPVFHEPTVREAFKKVMECDVSARKDHRSTLAIMNMVFAMSSLHHRIPSNRETNSEARAFYDNAMSLLQPTLLLDWNIEKVQALLLGVRYLQSSNSPDECWNVLGLAIRIAHGLELHLVPNEASDFVTKETAKRVWAACFCLDKLLSMIYGRPSITSTSNSSCPLPEDLDDDCIQKSRLLYPTPRKPSIIAFSIHVTKLYRIVEAADRMSSFEKPNWATLANAVFSLDEKLEEWYREVPNELKVHDGMDLESEPILILSLRANMVRILIHRHSLAVILQSLSGNNGDNQDKNSSETTMLQKSRNICLRAALETVTLVGMRNQRTIDAIGPGWFNLYYLFNAILVIVSHVIDPAFRNDRVALAHLDKAMYMINRMSRSHACAQRTYFFLKELLKLMDSWTSHEANNTALSAMGLHSTSPFTPQGLKQQTFQPYQIAYQNGSDANYNVDFSTLLDVTHDLAENLGSQLESYQNEDLAMWSWIDESTSSGAQSRDWSNF